MAKHQLGGDDAGSYAAAAVAAKAVVWVAIGIGAAPAAGGDPARRRRAWTRGRCCCARSRSSPWSPRRRCSIFAVVPELLLRIAFGPELTAAPPGALLGARRRR